MSDKMRELERYKRSGEQINLSPEKAQFDGSIKSVANAFYNISTMPPTPKIITKSKLRYRGRG